MSLNSPTSVYSICSDSPVPIFSEVLHLLPTILNIYLLVRLNSYLCHKKFKNINAMTIGYNEMNQTKRDTKLWKDIEIHVSLCKMDKFIGTWTA